MEKGTPSARSSGLAGILGWEASMKAQRILAMAILAAAGLAWTSTAANAQYYVPLRYDLRYTQGNPGYIGPSLYAPTPTPDPYAFGSLQYGNLGLTGNLRAGRSFQGNTPYNQQGSQVTNRLPSMALSNFKRDSVGLEDIGTGVEFGAPTPYFPGSGSVTTLYTAETRFATPALGARAPYGPLNLNTALPILPPTTAPPVFYVAPSALTGEAAVGQPAGLYVPAAALEWVKALAEGGPMAPKLPASTQTSGTTREGIQDNDPRIGLQKPTEVPDLRLGLPKPKNWEAVTSTAPEMPEPVLPYGITQPARPQEPYDATENALYWMVREAARREAATGTVGTTRPMPAPASPGQGVEEPEATDEPPTIPPAPKRFVPPGTYEDYMKRAEAAMKEANYAQAETVYSAASTQAPDKSAAIFGRAYALLGERQYPLATAVLDRTLRAHPEWVKEIPSLLTLLPKKDTFDRITGDLKTDLSKRPGNADLCFILGFIYYASGDRDEALFYLRHLSRLRTGESGPEQKMIEALEAAPPAP
jgi:hypothetical protein